MAEKKLFELQAELAEAVAWHNENSPASTPAELAPNKAKIKDLRAKIQEKLTEGAESCPECGLHPFGIEQPLHYEVGCLNEHEPRRQSKGRTIDGAVYNWNNEIYFKRVGTQVVKAKE